MHSICNFKYSVPTKIHITFHNGCNYDYNFIKKELLEEFEKKLLVQENTETHITLPFK